MAKKKPPQKPAARKTAKKAAAPRAASKKAPPKAAKKTAPKPKATKKAAKKAATPAVVHWEVQARDPAKQQAFFAELFSWKVDANNPMSYGMVEAGSKDGIGGGIGGGSGTSLVTVYVQVEDIDQTLGKAENLGAQTIMPRTDIGMVIMAQFRDPEGNVIGLIEG
jgi:predicted enzyme related to lactoylglutathione lyase